MELPQILRRAVDDALQGVALRDLVEAADRLSQRYRGEVRDGRFHLDDDLTARAYLATRLPATYAALRASLSALTEARPDFAPRTMLDFGAGPGTALWAALDCWPGLQHADLVEQSNFIRAYGERFAALAPIARADWHGSQAPGDTHRSDLVTASYVLDELSPGDRDGLIDRLWKSTADTLLIVEPGTPGGYRRILSARDRLLAAGALIVAPCPHHLACPLSPPDWCHFSRKVARSKFHRLAKSAEVPWEDETFIYLAASRHAGIAFDARVLAPPRKASGRVSLKLCQSDGTCAQTMVTRREGDPFRIARRLDWGDTIA